MLTMGLPAESVDASLGSERHDHIHTTYQLLLRKKPRVEAQRLDPTTHGTAVDTAAAT